MPLYLENGVVVDGGQMVGDVDVLDIGLAKL